MPQISRELLRKRAEHNEGLISTLEEISLHQEELESINEVLGATCRKLKILYLQNNIIPKIENLVHLKELEYLNLALNNITKIEGLQNCEFLRKIDLTVNFIDVDDLKESIEHLQSRDRLKELYMMGNPSQVNWPKFDLYVIAKLPQLESLDGKEITRSMQIVARQKLDELEQELEQLAIQKRHEKAERALMANIPSDCDEEIHSDSVKEQLTENTPEVRVEIYKELAQQKKEKEDRDKANRPKERNYEEEHAGSVETIRSKEESADLSNIKQKNEGGWEFFWDEESSPGNVILEITLAKHLDSSLIDVDVNPHYVSVIIKSKLLRLHTPAEVKVAESKCQRSKLTGNLKIVMPKVIAKEITLSFKPPESKGKALKGNSTRKVGEKKLTLQEQMLLDAKAVNSIQSIENQSKAVNIRNIVQLGDDELRETTILKSNSQTTTMIQEL